MKNESMVLTERSPMDQGRLDSWKEIANYLGREVRTCQRWEKQEGLPVHRHLHEKLGTVYAYRHELGAWLESRRTVAEAIIEEPIPMIATEAGTKNSSSFALRIAVGIAALVLIGFV